MKDDPKLSGLYREAFEDTKAQKEMEENRLEALNKKYDYLFEDPESLNNKI
jgi:hypothetical protein